MPVTGENDSVWGEQAGIRHRVYHVAADNRIDITLESGASISFWWTTRSEWEGLIDVAGLEVEARYGWFDGRPFDETSEEYVWVTGRPG